MDRNTFCRELGGRSILIVGDSINRQLFNFIVKFTGAANVSNLLYEKRGEIVNAVRQVGSVCDRNKITFVRNDILDSEPVLDFDCGFCVPWVHLLPSHDILILNAGAHVQDFQNYATTMVQLRRYLTEETSYTGDIIFRTTPRGHINCSRDDTPIASVNSTAWDRFFSQNKGKYISYHYDLMPRLNDFMISEMGSAATVLDVATMTELRPDGHLSPPRDCLHYRNPAVFKQWTILIYNALRGNL